MPTRYDFPMRSRVLVEGALMAAVSGAAPTYLGPAVIFASRGSQRI